MKKISIIFLCLIMLALCACQQIDETPQIIASTHETSTDLNRSKITTEQLQSDQVLYDFKGRNGKIGLINQNGELMVEPQFDEFSKVEVIDSDGRMIGLAVGKAADYYIYYFDGNIKKINEAIQYIHIFKVGRYAEINPNIRQISDSGLYDLQTEKYIIEPKNGQMINRDSDDFLVITSIWHDNKPGQIFNLQDGILREIPKRWTEWTVTIQA